MAAEWIGTAQHVLPAQAAEAAAPPAIEHQAPSEAAGRRNFARMLRAFGLQRHRLQAG
jgi:hypothetical protein